MPKLDRVLEAVFKGLTILAAAGVAWIFLVVFVNILARYVFNAPFHWSEEATSLTLVMIGFLPAAALWRSGRHVTFDLISRAAAERTPRLSRLLRAVVGLFGLLFGLVMIWQTWHSTSLSYVKNIREPSLLGTPLWIPYCLMLVGSLALFLAVLRELLGLWPSRRPEK